MGINTNASVLNVQRRLRWVIGNDHVSARIAAGKRRNNVLART